MVLSLPTVSNCEGVGARVVLDPNVHPSLREQGYVNASASDPLKGGPPQPTSAGEAWWQCPRVTKGHAPMVRPGRPESPCERASRSTTSTRWTSEATIGTTSLGAPGAPGRVMCNKETIGPNP